MHGLEARISGLQLKEGTQIKSFLKRPNCPDRITMTRWSLTDHHVHLLDEYMNFSGIPFVIELSLDNNFLGPEAAAVLASNIDDWKGGLHNIELFNIRGNRIGDDGAKSLAQVFQRHTMVRPKKFHSLSYMFTCIDVLDCERFKIPKCTSPNISFTCFYIKRLTFCLHLFVH